MVRSERMSPVDTTWLRMDRPANPMVITGILVLDGPVDLDRLETTLLDRLLAIPRFRMRIEANGLEYSWRELDRFDTAWHMRRARLPGKGGRAELERFVSHLASEGLDKNRPPWQFHIVEKYQGEGAVVVARLHHAIGDGIALIGVMLSLMDEVPGQSRGTFARGRDPGENESLWPLQALPESIRGGFRLSRNVLNEVLSLASSPVQSTKTGIGVAAELAYLLFMPSDTQTRFKGVPNGTKRVAWTDPIPLPEVKAVSRVLDCSVNDMLLASAAGAMHGYLAAKGDRTEGVEVRALVPVNLRSEAQRGELGNAFGIVAIELPVGIANPLARLAEVHKRMIALKSSLEPAVTLGLLAALGYAPQIVQDKLFDLLLSRASAVMTNVPGPQHPLFLAGAHLSEIMFWVPQSGDIGMGVSILSFNGQVQFGLMTDVALVPDPEAIIERFRPEFEQLLYFVLLAGAEGGPTEGARAASAAKPAGGPPDRKQQRTVPRGSRAGKKSAAAAARAAPAGAKRRRPPGPRP